MEGQSSQRQTVVWLYHTEISVLFRQRLIATLVQRAAGILLHLHRCRFKIHFISAAEKSDTIQLRPPVLI